MSHNQLVLRLLLSIAVIYGGSFLFDILEGYPPLHFLVHSPLSLLYGLIKFIIAAGVVVVILILPYLRSVQVKSTQLQAAAHELNLTYHDGDFHPNKSVLQSPLLQRGYRHYFGPAISGIYKNTEIESFYFSYLINRASDMDYTCSRTVVTFGSPECHIPNFVMAERDIGSKIVKGLFRSKSVDFPNDPEFFRRYSLKGEDMEAIRSFFGPALRSVLMHSKRTWALSGTNNRLIIFADGGFDEDVKAEDFIPYFQETWKIFESIGSTRKSL